MNIRITARRDKISQKLKDSITEELENLEKFNDKITSCHVVFDSEHVNKTVEMTLAIQKGTINAKAHADNLGKAVDSAIGKIRKQLIKINERVKEHKVVKELPE